MKVKICGIQTLDAAQAAFDAGADFVGFNFVPISKRLIDSEVAKRIIDGLPKGILKVGVFMNENLLRINKLVNYLTLDYVQLHGNESPDYIARIHNAAVIKTFALLSDFDVEETMEKMKTYKADYFLLDREVQGRGELLNLKKVERLTSVFPMILGGGLTPENVADAVKSAKPQAVDVAGGVETDGEKDKDKIIKFIQEVRNST